MIRKNGSVKLSVATLPDKVYMLLIFYIEISGDYIMTKCSDCPPDFEPKKSGTMT